MAASSLVIELYAYFVHMLTLVALVAHSILGCCGHHAHVGPTASSTADAQISLSPAVCSSHASCCQHRLPSHAQIKDNIPISKLPSAQTASAPTKVTERYLGECPSPCPDHCPEHCHGETCTYLLVNTRPETGTQDSTRFSSITRPNILGTSAHVQLGKAYDVDQVHRVGTAARGRHLLFQHWLI
ncbi:MAG: hypothetical protein IT423_16525 [Pirellulaceae bacterium]|nr:hypothetical protein [Pirellulaceae bacterium]